MKIEREKRMIELLFAPDVMCEAGLRIVKDRVQHRREFRPLLPPINQHKLNCIILSLRNTSVTLKKTLISSLVHGKFLCLGRLTLVFSFYAFFLSVLFLNYSLEVIYEIRMVFILFRRRYTSRPQRVGTAV